MHTPSAWECGSADATAGPHAAANAVPKPSRIPPPPWPVGADLARCLNVPRRADDDGPSLPGVEGFGRHWLLVTLTRLEQPCPYHTLHSSQPGPQPFSKLRGRDSDVVGMAATVKNMKCLGTTSLALEQLPLNKCLSCRVHKAGRKTHRVHRLSGAFVTSFCLKPMS